MKNNCIKRILIFIAGILILTLGVSLIYKSDLGLGSYDAVSFGLIKKFNISATLAMVITGTVSLIIGAILRKKMPKFISFITSVLIGGFLDVWTIILKSIYIESIIAKIVIFILGLILLCIGVSIYFIPKLPPNPIDDIVVALNEAKGLSLSKSKFIVDLVCIFIAFMLNGPIGIGTIILTLVLGPSIGIIQRYILSYILILKIDENSKLDNEELNKDKNIEC